MSVRTGEGFDGDGAGGDDISVLSLDEGQLFFLTARSVTYLLFWK